MQHILLEILIYLAAAVIAVPISQRLGFGSVLGYLAAGLLIGPVFGIVGAETEDLRHYAEFGVVLMLFLIGLELEPSALWAMRRQLIGLGGLQVGITLAAVYLFCQGMGLPWNQALAIGMILSLSSTAIVMQTLNEKRLNRTEGGRASFAVLLFQDIAALPFLAVIPLLTLGFVVPVADDHSPAAMIGELSAGMRTLLVAGAILLVVVTGRYLTRPLFRFLSLSRLHEIQIAAALLFIVAIAVMMDMLGLSPALGTFLAGVALANSEYRHELESDIAPFKGMLLGLFFITVGASMNLALLTAEPVRMMALVLALMASKFVILLALALVFRIKGRDRVLFTLSLAQAGEFGFFLTSFAETNRVIPPGQADVLLLIVSLSMFLTPALFLLHDNLITWIVERQRPPDEEAIEEGPVIVAGMGRFGQIVNRMVKGLGHDTVVLDSHPDVIAQMRSFGIRAFYGDVDRPSLLEAAGIAKAKAIVIAIDDAEKAVKLARYVSARHPKVRIIARAHNRHHVYQLFAAGAHDIVREMFDSSVRAGKYSLSALGYSNEEIDRVAVAFSEHDRHMLAELAKLWKPDVPTMENTAYLDKAREQYATIESVLRGQLTPQDKAAE